MSFLFSSRAPDGKRSNSLVPTWRLLFYVIVLLSPLSLYLFTPCIALSGAQFRTQNEIEEVVVLPNSDSDPPQPGITTSYHPTISFGYATYEWQYSDMLTLASYYCIGPDIIASHPSGFAIQGHYNPFTGVLIWDGKVYQKTSQGMFSFLTYLLCGIAALLIVVLVRRRPSSL